jgi:hypothetical protein
MLVKKELMLLDINTLLFCLYRIVNKYLTLNF